MKTILTYETTTPDGLRDQSKSVADMHPAIEAFEKSMGALGHKGIMTIRHVRPKTSTVAPVANGQLPTGNPAPAELGGSAPADGAAKAE